MHLVNLVALKVEKPHRRFARPPTYSIVTIGSVEFRGTALRQHFECSIQFLEFTPFIL
jgi:hypothetical protein